MARGEDPFEVRVARVCPLSEAREAHEALGRHRLGKILLAPRS